MRAGRRRSKPIGLTKRFDKFVAVDHVSFKIEKGEIFGFLGSNGCGKSTTMKMLTGLLPPTEGTAKLFGEPVSGKEDMAMRRRVGYMSQAFSLYGELSVRRNLELHAKLFDLPVATRGKCVDEMLDRFGLREVADVQPESLPLGIRQRLQLAVAIQHSPEMLILDEPTSGVDPVARDQFWEYLIALSRNDGVTIFLSTHFMNEAMRCDRISLMNAGKVLAAGTPPELIEARHAKSLEEAFIEFLEDASGAAHKGEKPPEPAAPSETKVFAPPKASEGGLSITRLWAYARREAVEIMRDPVRIAFALFNPIILMFAIGYGISFDVEHLRWAVFDQDRSLESRQFLDSFQNPKYFDRKPDIRSADQIVSGLRSGELKFAVEVPTNFGHDLITQQTPEIGAWISGDMPFRAETTRSYLGGVMQSYLADLSARLTGTPSSFSLINIEQRYRYNQSFKSIYSEVPSTIMVMLILIPAIMTALGVVREVETGSIANFRSTPITRLEFLLGKQLPYVLIGVSSFATLVLSGDFRVRRAGHGLLGGAHRRRLPLRVRGDRVWPLDVDPRSHAGGRGVRNNLHCPHSNRQLLRPARSGLVPLRRRARHRSRLSVVLVPADQRRRLHQGAWLSRALDRPSGVRNLHRRLSRRGGAHSAEAGGLRCSGSSSTSSRWA